MWAKPFELNHGEHFPDSSSVVPFGCAVLVLLKKEEKEKFKATCAMVIFVHYALDNPFNIYALFSPRTKRVVFKQDCIFLPKVFPMREARSVEGLALEGATLGKDEEMSFKDRKDEDPMLAYQDRVTGHTLISPNTTWQMRQGENLKRGQVISHSFHPSFFLQSVVKVPRPWGWVKSTTVTQK